MCEHCIMDALRNIAALGPLAWQHALMAVTFVVAMVKRP